MTTPARATITWTISDNKLETFRRQDEGIQPSQIISSLSPEDCYTIIRTTSLVGSLSLSAFPSAFTKQAVLSVVKATEKLLDAKKLEKYAPEDGKSNDVFLLDIQKNYREKCAAERQGAEQKFSEIQTETGITVSTG